MGRKLSERSRSDLEVAELVEILNSEDHTSSSSLPTPLLHARPDAGQQRRAEGVRPPATVLPKQDSSTSALSGDAREALVRDKEGRSWWARHGHSFSPPERDPPSRRRESGGSGSEELEVLRSLADSETLVRQLRAERRARKEARSRGRRQKEEERRRQAAAGEASRSDRGARDESGVLLPDSLSYESQTLEGLSYGAAALDDPFLQAIAWEDSLLGGINESKAADAQRAYLNVMASSQSTWQRDSGNVLQTEWQSLASLLEQSLAGLAVPEGNGGSVFAHSQADHVAVHAVKEPPHEELLQSLGCEEVLEDQGGKGWSTQHLRSSRHGGRASEIQAHEAGRSGPVKVRLREEDAGPMGWPATLNALGFDGKELHSSSRFLQGNAGKGDVAAIVPMEDTKRSRITEPVVEVGVEDKKTTEDARQGGQREELREGQQGWDKGRATAAAQDSEELLRLQRTVELNCGEIAQLHEKLEELEAALAEKERAAAALADQLEQQRAEHARSMQALRSSFDDEKRALLKQTGKAAGASKCALQSQLTAAEADRVEMTRRLEEQERLLKEGKKREARLQETNRALLQRDKGQKAENEALTRELESTRTAARETAALLESARREAKALRGRAEELEREKEMEKAGVERAREAGARSRRDLTEAKAALKNAEAVQARCQAEVNALRKQLKEVEEDAVRERTERENVQARFSECEIRCQQLKGELDVSRRWGQSEKDRCQLGKQGDNRAEEDLPKVGHSSMGQSTSSSSDSNSVSFLTPSPETSPEQLEGAHSAKRESARTGRLGASAARSISFADPLATSISDLGNAKASIQVSGTRKSLPPEVDTKHSDEKGGLSLIDAPAEGAGGSNRSLSSSDSSLEGPPRPWAWSAKPSRADHLSQALLEKPADSRSRSRLQIQRDLPLGASAEAQSRFYDLKEAYLRVLQTKGLH